MQTIMKEIYDMNIFYEAFIIIAQNIKMNVVYPFRLVYTTNANISSNIYHIIIIIIIINHTSFLCVM